MGETVEAGATQREFDENTGSDTLSRLDKMRHADGGTKTAELRLEMQRAMQENCAVFRTGEVLEEGVQKIDAVSKKAAGMRVDVSHRNVAIDVRGTQVHDVLNTGVPLDLDDVAFPVGTATRTLFAKAEIVLVRCDDQDGLATFRIECWRSFARYLVGHLTQSAALLGFGPI